NILWLASYVVKFGRKLLLVGINNKNCFAKVGRFSLFRTSRKEHKIIEDDSYTLTERQLADLQYLYIYIIYIRK
ncbi:hypothetical protein, partial [Acinetobacter baumannii]|uniref:hypothetical protein n=1 Tax=Acinetobacter baumannii TaxID=470 RepID=UPI001C06E7DC